VERAGANLPRRAPDAVEVSLIWYPAARVTSTKGDAHSTSRRARADQGPSPKRLTAVKAELGEAAGFQRGQISKRLGPLDFNQGDCAVDSCLVGRRTPPPPGRPAW